MENTHFFAGANSAQGFCSHYRYLALDNFKRVYILKGGPGTGKSTIIKHLASQINRHLEKYHCTADPDSLDGLFIPSLQISILDGTAPHTIDPRLPGAVQQTVDLGSAWDYRALTASSQRILELTDEISSLYELAYRWLAVGSGLKELIQLQERRQNAAAYAEECFAEIQGYIPDIAQGVTRKAFASGLTGKGTVSFVPALSAKIKIGLLGNNRSFNSYILNATAHWLQKRKTPAVYLYCGLQPEYLEHIYIPGEFALLSSHSPHSALALDMAFGQETPGNSDLEQQAAYFIDKAVSTIAAAAKLHADLEGFYTPHVNFAKVQKLRTGITDEIAELAKEADNNYRP
jgi:hypothetical protein